jgi:hypothetical protein
MDKVKQILEVLRKHHFWILCGIAALIGLVVWYNASGKLEAEFQRDSKKIDTTFADLRQIQNPHPNGKWTEAAGKEINAARNGVYTVWTKLYEEQKQKAFIWPEQLGKRFLDAVPGLDANPPALPADLRELYQNMIKQVAADLATDVDAPVIVEAAGGVQAPPPDANSELDHKVLWPQLADIQSSFDFPDQPPSALLVKLMQEELWVYKALCKVIEEVNRSASGPRDAPISAIEEIAVAYAAVDDSSASGGQRGIIHKANSPGAPPAAPSGDASRPPKPDVKTRGKPDAQHPTTGAEGAPANPDDYWKSWRYVKPTGEPLMAAELDSASAEYNLMPIRLKLDMNPDFLDRFLVECRNSALPIEIKSVRINPGVAQSLAGTGGATRAEPIRSDAGGAVRGIHSQKIEITGVVYLVKPPDPQKLGITPSEPGTTETAAVAPPGGAVASPANTEAPK